jgi:hypothetical protein
MEAHARVGTAYVSGIAAALTRKVQGRDLIKTREIFEFKRTI